MINWNQLNELTAGDQEFQHELLNEFLQQTPALIEQLHQALEQGDGATFIRLAHTLKGSARTVGAESLADIASTLEHHGRMGDLRHAPAMLQQLSEQWQPLQQYLYAYLFQQAA